MLGKLFGLISLGETLIGANMTRRFVREFIAVLGLAIVAAFLTGGLIVGALIGFYVILVDHGLDKGAAIGLAAGVAVVLLAGVVFAMKRKLALMHAMPGSGRGDFALPPLAQSLAHSFYRGFTAPPKPKA